MKAIKHATYIWVLTWLQERAPDLTNVREDMFRQLGADFARNAKEALIEVLTDLKNQIPEKQEKP